MGSNPIFSARARIERCVLFMAEKARFLAGRAQCDLPRKANCPPSASELAAGKDAFFLW